MRLDRVERQESVLVDVISCQENPALVDTSLDCCTVDVSEGGMKVASHLDIPVESILGLRVDMSSIAYRLEGKVRWCAKDDSHHIGLLIDQNSPDFVNWTRNFQLDF